MKPRGATRLSGMAQGEGWGWQEGTRRQVMSLSHSGPSVTPHLTKEDSPSPHSDLGGPLWSPQAPRASRSLCSSHAAAGRGGEGGRPATQLPGEPGSCRSFLRCCPPRGPFPCLSPSPSLFCFSLTPRPPHKQSLPIFVYCLSCPRRINAREGTGQCLNQAWHTVGAQ